jgi:hypothetical protein
LKFAASSGISWQLHVDRSASTGDPAMTSDSDASTMISTGTLMLAKALLTAGVIMGFLLRELWLLRRMKREDEVRKADAARAAHSPENRDEGATGTTGR